MGMPFLRKLPPPRSFRIRYSRDGKDPDWTPGDALLPLRLKLMGSRVALYYEDGTRDVIQAMDRDKRIRLHKKDQDHDSLSATDQVTLPSCILLPPPPNAH